MTPSAEDRELVNLFVEETRERLEAIEPALVELEQTESPADRQRILHEIFRHLHSTKGSAGYLGLNDLVALLHAAEQLADVLRNGAPLAREHIDMFLRAATHFKSFLVALVGEQAAPEGMVELASELNAAAQTAGSGAAGEPAPTVTAAASDSAEQLASSPARNGSGPGSSASQNDSDLFASTVRVPMDVLDRLGRLAEEMLVTRNRITSLATSFQDLELTGASKKLSVMVSELQDIASLTRLQPIASLFSQMPRVVRDAARSTGKDAEVVVEGGSLEVDRRILQELRDPLVHLLRNAADHGLEMPQERIAHHKPSKGTIHLTAHREGSNLVIEVADDGAGIDFERVRQKAIERGMAGAREAAALSEAELIAILLRPGFSTRDAATNLSGRGVGMDVVSVRMQELGGSLSIQAALGQGTTVRLTVPTSVSVVNTLVFTSKGYLLGVPYNFVQEIVRIEEHQVERYGAQEVFRLRDQLVPLFRLDAWPERRAAVEPTTKRYVLVLRDRHSVAGLWCDGIARFEELIVKPVGNVIRGVDVISGLASLGTGEIVQILEPERLLADIGLAPAGENGVELAELPAHNEHAEASDDFAERMILVQGYGQYRYALPVRLVSRIVQFSEQELVPMGDLLYLRLGDDLVPLLDLDEALALGAGHNSRGIALLLVSDGRPSALAAREVVRIGAVAARPEPTDHRNVIGLLSLPDAVYMLIDVVSLLHDKLRGYFGAESESARKSLNGRVLLVEDSAFFRDSLEAVLRNAGLTVIARETVELALATLARDGAFDMIVTDYLLPAKSGLDLIQEVRAGGTSIERDVPVLVMSQHLAEPHNNEAIDLASRLRAAGATEVVAKFDQLDQNGLVNLIRRLLTHTSGHLRVEQQQAEARAAAEEMVHVLAVNLGGEAYGIPIAQVREITTLDGLTTTPVSAGDFLGLANIRGEIIPVFDLGGVLRRPARIDSSRQVDVVIVTGLGPMVLRSDSIRGTIKILRNDLRQPTGNLGELAEVVEALVTLPDCLLQVLDIEPLAASCLSRREMTVAV